MINSIKCFFGFHYTKTIAFTNETIQGRVLDGMRKLIQCQYCKKKFIYNMKLNKKVKFDNTDTVYHYRWISR